MGSYFWQIVLALIDWYTFFSALKKLSAIKRSHLRPEAAVGFFELLWSALSEKTSFPQGNLRFTIALSKSLIFIYL